MLGTIAVTGGVYITITILKLVVVVDSVSHLK